jgi:hypothetical protein
MHWYVLLPQHALFAVLVHPDETVVELHVALVPVQHPGGTVVELRVALTSVEVLIPHIYHST